MTNPTAIAINRAKPLLREAAEAHEQVNQQLKQWSEVTGGLCDLAQRIGQKLESARLAIKSSGAPVSFDEVLEAHAPNIPVKQADKYMRFARGEITDVRQLTLPFMAKELPEHAESLQRAKPAAWETAWGYAKKLIISFRDAPVTEWKAEQVKYIRSELEPVAKQLWPERFV